MPLKNCKYLLKKIILSSKLHLGSLDCCGPFDFAKSKFSSRTDNSCIFGNSKMRHCFLQVQSLVGRLVDMGITEILPRKTYEVDDFFARQKSLVSDFATNFGDFRNIVCQLVLDTCRSTFSDAGFIYEVYPHWRRSALNSAGALREFRGIFTPKTYLCTFYTINFGAGSKKWGCTCTCCTP